MELKDRVCSALLKPATSLLESIQWNWKGLMGSRRRAFNKGCRIHTMELKERGRQVGPACELTRESIQWNWKTLGHAGRDDDNKVGNPYNGIESIEASRSGLLSKLIGIHTMELKVDLRLTDILLSFHRIHTMELKVSFPSINIFISAPRIHTMELKVGRGACSTYMLFREPNPYNGIESRASTKAWTVKATPYRLL